MIPHDHHQTRSWVARDCQILCDPTHPVCITHPIPPPLLPQPNLQQVPCPAASGQPSQHLTFLSLGKGLAFKRRGADSQPATNQPAGTCHQSQTELRSPPPKKLHQGLSPPNCQVCCLYFSEARTGRLSVTSLGKNETRNSNLRAGQGA